MALTELPAPGNVAYFTVRIPVDRADRNSARAREIVERYLYSGAIVDSDLADDNETFLVLVRVETTGTAADLERQVTANRDRLLSGLYGSSEPRYLTAVSGD